MRGTVERDRGRRGKTVRGCLSSRREDSMLVVLRMKLLWMWMNEKGTDG
jgi:hypothetical protein